LGDILADFESSHIEEIVCLRFNQLECLLAAVFLTTHYQLTSEGSSPRGFFLNANLDAVRESVHGLIPPEGPNKIELCSRSSTGTSTSSCRLSHDAQPPRLAVIHFLSFPTVDVENRSN
jgi:hypothetical protein